MNYLLTCLVLVSSISFLGYSLSFFVNPKMKAEFKRFNMEKLGPFTVFLQILGSVGLLIGFLSTPILLLASGGLALLMFSAFWVRMYSKDRLTFALPAIFYMVLNAVIFYLAWLK